MKWLRLVAILLLPFTAQAGTYYASTAGSGTACTNIATPCNLRDLLGQRNGITVTAPATIYLRGGAYLGKYWSTISGTTGQNDITVQSYPGEWAIIDGYSTTTTSSTFVTVDAFHSRVHLTANPGLLTAAGGGAQITSFIVLDQTDPGNDEGFTVDTVEAANSYLVVGIPALSHSIGALVTTQGNNLTINGHDVIYRDFEIRNSDPNRVQSAPDSQSSPTGRGEGVWLDGRNKLVNLVIHDCQEGIFSTPDASGSQVYGCVIYNNGYRAGGVNNGHGTYDQNDDGSTPFLIQDDIVFNNFATGVKGESQNANTIGVALRGIIAFNSGCYETNPGQRRGNLLLGANNGTLDQVSIDQCYVFDPAGTVGGGGGIGPFTGNTGTGSVTDSWFSGSAGVGFNGVPTSVTESGIRSYIASNYGYIASVDDSVSTSTIDNNEYWNTTGVTTVFTKQFVQNYTFAQWKANLGYDLNSTYSTSAPPTNWIVTRPNAYDSSRWSLAIFNHLGSSTVNVPMPSGWSNGDTWAWYPAEACVWHGPGSTPVQTGTVSGGVVAISMSANTVIGPIGLGETANSMAPAFTGGLLFRTAQATIPASVIGGSSKISGSVFH